MNFEDQRTSCPGFLDEYGVWNNGFECPSLSNRIRVCCGSDSVRYCCTLKPLDSSEKSFLSSNKTILSFFKKINQPIQLVFILIFLFLLLLILIIIFLYYRSHQRKNHRAKEKKYSKKQTLIIDHFPFTPPHHQVFFNENSQQIKDTLTTSTSSSSPARLPSEFYFNDWKEYFNPTDQTLNIQSNETHHYLVHGKYQQNDIIV